MLTYYITQTQRLLQNPGAPTSLYSTADLTSYINTMRGQLAGESACIRSLGSIATVAAQRNYNFESIAFSTAGVAGALNVRSIRYAVGSGFKTVYPRPWEWFDLYANNNPVPDSGAPEIWAQYAQGAGGIVTAGGNVLDVIANGSFFLDPVPDIVYSLTLDCACYPDLLALNTDPEAIPYEFTDAVPFGAAWMALLSSQTAARMQDAERYLSYFKMYVQRARDAANSDVLKYQYEKQTNITLPNQVGIQPGKGQ